MSLGTPLFKTRIEFNMTTPATPEVLLAAQITQLIARMAQADEAALGHFYETTLSRVYGLALRITGRHDLAEEVCIETYWQVWREADRYDATRGEPFAWLMMMTRSRALDTLRRQDSAMSHADPEIYLESEHCPEPQPIDYLLSLEMAGALGRALALLTPVQRQMVGLAFYRDLSHQEISTQTGLPLGTVKSHLKRAQNVLRVALCQA